MAVNVRYVARETGINLRRNFSLTLASVVTVAVSLTLFGAALVFAQGVGNMTARWKGGIEFIVFMQPSASPVLQALALSAVFVALAAASDAGYVLVAAAVAPALRAASGVGWFWRYFSAAIYFALSIYAAASGSRAPKG